MQTSANISQAQSQRCPLHNYTPHSHTDDELLCIAGAVIAHVLRRSHPEVGCEHCYTSLKRSACGMCVHRYATLPPAAKPARVQNGLAELEIEADAAFIQQLEHAIRAIPAPHGLDLLGYYLAAVRPPTPAPLAA